MVHRTQSENCCGTLANPVVRPHRGESMSSAAQFEPAYLKITPAACCCTTGLPRGILEDACCQGERHD